MNMVSRELAWTCGSERNQLGSAARRALYGDELNLFDSSLDDLQQANIKLVGEIARLERELAMEKRGW
jgi:hypothetical protein